MVGLGAAGCGAREHALTIETASQVFVVQTPVVMPRTSIKVMR